MADDMTGDTFPRSLTGRIIELAKIVSAVSVLISAAVGIWAFTGPAREVYDLFVQLIEDVDTLKKEVARANGEDRVIRQPPGQSYIKEPVRLGENVVMIAVVGRTRLGADCRLTDWTPIFTDEFNIPTPGDRAISGPVRRQIGADVQTLRMEMVPPRNLRPGRVTVYLTLTYECPTADGGSVIVPDATDVLPFELLRE